MPLRRRVLLTILSLLVGVWVATTIWKNSVSTPISERAYSLQQLQGELQDLKLRQAELRHSAQELAAINLRSLPADAVDGQRLYQSWITDMALDSGLSHLEVSPLRRKSLGEFHTAVELSVDGQGTTQSLIQLIYEIKTTDLLHRLNDISVERVTGEEVADGTLLLGFRLEALSLKTSEERQTLFPQIELVDRDFDNGKATLSAAATERVALPASLRIGKVQRTILQVDGNDISLARNDRFGSVPFNPDLPAEIVRRTSSKNGRPLESFSSIWLDNPFEPPRPKISFDPPPSSAAPNPQVFDSTPYTYLIATITDQSQPQAWLFDRANNQTMVLEEGSVFTLSSEQATVKTIKLGMIVLEKSNRHWRLEVGKNLSELSLHVAASFSHRRSK